ncbi:MAG TPA: glycine betaine ABC transporter substrate-binding protein, partial [Gemmatimonadaceae bacterium]|nr:glycine betaine ABC transporter substrate-binding protein [Gemmatimonadaceae bacterium]
MIAWKVTWGTVILVAASAIRGPTTSNVQAFRSALQTSRISVEGNSREGASLSNSGEIGDTAPLPRRPIVVASKPFAESYLLCEMFAQLLESRGFRVDRRPGLGSTEVTFGALRENAVDVYPEYTGTGLLAVLHDTMPDSLASDPRAVYSRVEREFNRRFGVRWLPPLGFQDTYAIAIRKATAAQFRLRTLSDLSRVSSRLVAGFTADFIGRSDGLPGLERAYGIRVRAVHPLAPAVKYQALAAGAVDVVDGYSTDGVLSRYDLVTLVDDRHFFPPYEAAAVVGTRLQREAPDAVAVLTLLSDRLSESDMRELNRRIEVDGQDVARVAHAALNSIGLVEADHVALSASTAGRLGGGGGLGTFLWARRATIAALAARHLELVLVALLAAVLVGLPVGLLLERARRVAEPAIGALGVVQTVPSIALLAFMIPFFGIGVLPALVALWLYALYPIARSTYVGVRDAAPDAVEAAEALGTTGWQRLILVRLPLAAPSIVSGIRTASVILVGAATLAAFIGAGGLGEPIVAGLALADTRLVL